MAARAHGSPGTVEEPLRSGEEREKKDRLKQFRERTGLSQYQWMTIITTNLTKL